jgi:hypothetical protein
MKKRIVKFLGIAIILAVLTFNFQTIYNSVYSENDVSLTSIVQNAKADGEPPQGGSGGNSCTIRCCDWCSWTVTGCNTCTVNMGGKEMVCYLYGGGEVWRACGVGGVCTSCF